ncbi:membrane-associated protein, putative, partial [Bodo saltans]
MHPRRQASSSLRKGKSSTHLNVVIAVMVLWLTSYSPSALARTDIRSSQDGFGFSEVNSFRVVVDISNPVTLNGWPSGTNVPVASGSYCGGVYDGRYYWLTPYSANHVLRVKRTTGAMDAYTSWPSGFTVAPGGFCGGIYDGVRVWFVPAAQRSLICIFVETQVMQELAIPAISSLTALQVAFIGSAYDRLQYMWLAPYDSPVIVRVDTIFFNLVSYSAWPTGFTKSAAAFSGAIYFSESTTTGVTPSPVVVFVPHNANNPIMLYTVDGSMVMLSWPSGYVATAGAFFGGVNDGRGGIWLIPYNSASIVRFDLNHLPAVTSSSFAVWPTGYTKAASAFRGGVYDGKSVWMIPYNSPNIVTVSVYTGLMSLVGTAAYPSGFVKGPAAFVGGVFDGQGFIMIPAAADRIVQYLGTSETGSMSKTVIMTVSRVVTPHTHSRLTQSSSPSYAQSRSESYSLSSSSSISPSKELSLSVKSFTSSTTYSMTSSGSTSTSITYTLTLRQTRSSGSHTWSASENLRSGSTSDTPSNSDELSPTFSATHSGETLSPTDSRSPTRTSTETLSISSTPTYSKESTKSLLSPTFEISSSHSGSQELSESTSKSFSDSSLPSSSETISS